MYELDELIKLRENGVINFGEREMLINILLLDNKRLQDFQIAANEVYPSLELEIQVKQLGGRTLEILQGLPKRITG